MPASDVEVAEFIDGLVEGTGLEAGDPRLTLSKYMVRQQNNGTLAREDHKRLWLLVSVWNHWRAGRQLWKITSPTEWSNDKFPTVK